MKLKAIIASLIMLIGMLLPVTPAEASLSNNQYERRVQYQINQTKQDYGLRTVRRGHCVDPISERWAYQLRNTDYWNLPHQDMWNIIRECNRGGAGEVLALGGMSPNRAVDMWLDSPTHRRVLLDGDYTHIGTGVRRVDDGRRIVVVDFTHR